jgi:hypothetical protein
MNARRRWMNRKAKDGVVPAFDHGVDGLWVIAYALGDCRTFTALIPARFFAIIIGVDRVYACHIPLPACDWETRTRRVGGSRTIHEVSGCVCFECAASRWYSFRRRQLAIVCSGSSPRRSTWTILSQTVHTW